MRRRRARARMYVPLSGALAVVDLETNLVRWHPVDGVFASGDPIPSPPATLPVGQALRPHADYPNIMIAYDAPTMSVRLYHEHDGAVSELP